MLIETRLIFVNNRMHVGKVVYPPKARWCITRTSHARPAYVSPLITYYTIMSVISNIHVWFHLSTIVSVANKRSRRRLIAQLLLINNPTQLSSYVVLQERNAFFSTLFSFLFFSLVCLIQRSIHDRWRTIASIQVVSPISKFVHEELSKSWLHDTELQTIDAIVSIDDSIITERACGLRLIEEGKERLEK